jgi:hypothetical protein
MKRAPVDPRDVVIRQRRAGGFVLTTNISPRHIAYATFEEALANAGRVAEDHDVHVWYADDQQPPIQLEQHLLARVWAEYCELPGLGLTDVQARRLWGVDADTCTALLDVLVRARLLTRGIDGRYRRFAADAVGSGARMAKAASPAPAPLVVAGADRRRHV